jgi:hypothetical protein
MAPLTDISEKALLDWVLGGAGVSRPTQRWLQFATASPTTASAFDGPFSPRCTVTFGAAASPAGSATNANAISATATAAGTAVGWNLYNASVAGTRLAYGTLTANIGCKSADNPALSAGTLRVTLA